MTHLSLKSAQKRSLYHDCEVDICSIPLTASDITLIAQKKLCNRMAATIYMDGCIHKYALKLLCQSVQGSFIICVQESYIISSE